jgi:hypothetical protein
MENAKNLCLLPYARPQFRELTHKEEEHEFFNQLPSWCPDWHTCAWGDYFDIYNFGGFTADKMLSYDGTRQCETILMLEGVFVDTIAAVGPLIDDMQVSPTKFVPIIEQWLDLAKERELGPREIWELVHVATHKEIGLDKVDLQADFWGLLKRLADKGASFQELQDAVVEEQHQFCSGSMAWLDKRAVFVTEPSKNSRTSLSEAGNRGGISEYRSMLPNGSVGMALPNVRQGDAIFIIKGGRTPLVFRSLSNQSLRERALTAGISEDQLSKCFTFVGITYIYGMMQGQGIAENPSWERIYLL